MATVPKLPLELLFDIHGRTSSETLLATGDFAHTRRLVLRAASLELISDGLLASLLSLSPVNGLHENALVLEHVTLALQVHLVVHVLVDLLGLAIPEKRQ